MLLHQKRNKLESKNYSLKNENLIESNISIWCQTCKKEIDRGIIDINSALIINPVQLQKHKIHEIMVRMASNADYDLKKNEN